MKKEYKEVKIEVVYFEAEDIVTSSGCPLETIPIIDPDD